MRRVLGWNWKVRRLRKRWDRLREKALKKKNPVRSEALKMLDTVSPNLTTLEEQHLGRVDRARISKDIEISLEGIKELLKAKASDLRAEKEFRERQ